MPVDNQCINPKDKWNKPELEIYSVSYIKLARAFSKLIIIKDWKACKQTYSLHVSLLYCSNRNTTKIIDLWQTSSFICDEEAIDLIS